jgi:hypothetical protein
MKNKIFQPLPAGNGMKPIRFNACLGYGGHDKVRFGLGDGAEITRPPPCRRVYLIWDHTRVRICSTRESGKGT